MSRTPALILLLVVLAFVAGLLASSMFNAASTSETGRLPGAPTGSRDTELVALLGELRAELTRLNDHLQRGSPMPSSMPAERRREPDPNTDTLGAIIELTSALKSSARMVPSPGDYGVGLRAPVPDATR